MRFGVLLAAAAGWLVLGTTASAKMSWSGPVTVSRHVTLTGVTCRSPSLCVVYGNGGRLLVSSHAAGGVAAWKVRQIDGATDLKGVSCPSALLCVAHDASGWVLASKRALGRASTWRRFARDRELNSLTCPVRPLCIGVESTGDVMASTDPARAGSWRRFFIADRSPTYGCVHYQDPGE